MIIDDIKDFFFFAPSAYFEMRKLGKKLPSVAQEIEDFEKQREAEVMASIPSYKEGEYMELVRSAEARLTMKRPAPGKNTCM